jgi:hypothetical protein
MLRRSFNKLRYDFPKLSNELYLLYSVKAINDIANSRGLVPTTLVFGTNPSLFTPTAELKNNTERFSLMASAR